MASDETYRREEDRKWREKVDERLTSLTTDVMLSQDRLDEIEDMIKQIDELLKGPASDKNDNGLKGDIHDISLKVNRLWAVVFMDAIGEKGMWEDFKALRRKEHRWEVNRTSLTAIVVAVISTLGLLLNEWPHFHAWLFEGKPDKLETMVENAKHPKSHYRHYTVTPTETEDNE